MAKSSRIFVEHDNDRLVRRLRAVTAGDLSTREIEHLVEGDLTLVQDLPRVSQQAVRALVAPDSGAVGELEKMVGVAFDYVPVAYLDLARMAAKAVARVVDDKRRSIGTGTMVSPRLFLTNHHVTGDPGSAVRQILQFDYEQDVDGTPRSPVEFALEPDTFFWTSPEDELDATLVAVGRPVSDGRRLEEFGYCGLSGAGDKHADGDFVTVVQHPSGDLKQIALRENRVIGRGKKGVTLHYGADTLPGSSGSPVFNDQFELVALHHAGGQVNEKLLENGDAVPDESNEGIRISVIVHRLREVLDGLPASFRAVLSEALQPPTEGPHPMGPPLVASGSTGGTVAGAVGPVPVVGGVTSAAGGSFHAHVGLPLLLTIDTPQPGRLDESIRPEPVATSTGGFERNQPPDPEYSRRRGYDPDFLVSGAAADPVTVPVPRLSNGQLRAVAVPDGGDRTAGGVLLRYLHFSVAQNARRRMPFFTAVNIDGRRARSINRETGEVEATETWYADPRIGAEEQLDQPVFERQRPRLFDRGHMVRRLDPAWGSAATARRASDDTFHFTNCSPQISAFNQRARLWAGIENFVLVNAAAERQRVSVFTGPIFGDDDPQYREVRVPRAFWKLLVRLEEGALRCTAFRADQGELLDQGLRSAQPEGFADLGTVALFQTSVKQIEDETGLGFGDLAAHDTLSLESGAGTPINSPEDIDW